MERTIEVATGESVAFRYELAGLGSRFFAVFIDFAIQIAIAVGVFFLLIWLGTLLESSGAAKHVAKATQLDKIAQAVVVAFLVFVYFLIFFGYFILFEWLWGGRTPGKRLLGLRVVRDGGFPIDFMSSLIRNLVRILEFGFFFYGISAVSTLLSPQNRRIGDYAAGTIVVRDERFERDQAVPWQAPKRDGPDPVTRDLSSAERDLVLRFVARRKSLAPASRAAVARQIASAVRPKLGANFAHLDDDELLVHLANTALN